eukprot:517843_1
MAHWLLGWISICLVIVHAKYDNSCNTNDEWENKYKMLQEDYKKLEIKYEELHQKCSGNTRTQDVYKPRRDVIPDINKVDNDIDGHLDEVNKADNDDDDIYTTNVSHGCHDATSILNDFKQQTKSNNYFTGIKRILKKTSERTDTAMNRFDDENDFTSYVEELAEEICDREVTEYIQRISKDIMNSFKQSVNCLQSNHITFTTKSGGNMNGIANIWYAVKTKGKNIILFHAYRVFSWETNQNVLRNTDIKLLKNWAKNEVMKDGRKQIQQSQQ